MIWYIVSIIACLLANVSAAVAVIAYIRVVKISKELDQELDVRVNETITTRNKRMMHDAKRTTMPRDDRGRAAVVHVGKTNKRSGRTVGR